MNCMLATRTCALLIRKTRFKAERARRREMSQFIAETKTTNVFNVLLMRIDQHSVTQCLAMSNYSLIFMRASSHTLLAAYNEIEAIIQSNDKFFHPAICDHINAHMSSNSI